MRTNKECLIELFYENNVRCDQTIEHLADDVIDIFADLINRQKAEIEALIAGQETLQKYIATQKAEIERLEDVNTRLTKAEAVKEFAERLKEKAGVCYLENIEFLAYRITADSINKLVAEMVGDNNVNTERKEDEGK